MYFSSNNTVLQGGYILKADKIFYNARILTVDHVNSVASAFAIHEDVILKVGTDQEVLALADSNTEIVNVDKKTIIPGFYDAHGHFFSDSEVYGMSANLFPKPIGNCQNFADCFAALQVKIDSTPAGQWVQGYGFDDTMVAEKCFFTRHELDALSTEHPIVVRHISGHFGVLNSKALDIVGYTKDSLDPEGGVLRRESDGKTPNGVLEETAIIHVRSKLPPLAIEEMQQYYMQNAHRIAQKGVTTAVDAGYGTKERISAVRKLIENDSFPLRLLVSGFNAVNHDPLLELESDKYVRTGGVKFLQDGSIQGYTAFLSTPYHTTHPVTKDADWCGYPIHTRETLYEKFLEQHKKNRQIIVHTNGDQAIEDVLDTFELVQNQYPRHDSRLLLIHAQTIRDDQLDRCKQLGITLSFFGVHTYYWGDRHKAIFLGPERAEKQNPIQSALQRGLVCSSHNDAPITPLDPLFSMWVCVNRLSASGQCIGASQKISPLEALRAHTYSPAWQNFEEKEKGSIEEGKLADFVILSDDPTECDPMYIKDIKILATYMGGQRTFSNV